MRLTLLMIFVTATMVSRIASADSALPPEACSSLAAVNLSKLEDAPTHISAARVVNATQEHAAFCQVTGYVAPQVGFAIRLPLYDWNRRFIMVGCGGMCGEFWTEIGVCDGPLQKGYACVVTDMRHKGNAPGDALWASNNLQAEVD